MGMNVKWIALCLVADQNGKETRKALLFAAELAKVARREWEAMHILTYIEGLRATQSMCGYGSLLTACRCTTD